MPVREGLPVREGPPEPAPPMRGDEPRMRPVESSEPYPAEKARGGEIILRTPLRRAVFIGGLVGLVVLVLALQLMA